MRSRAQKKYLARCIAEAEQARRDKIAKHEKIARRRKLTEKQREAQRRREKAQRGAARALMEIYGG